MSTKLVAGVITVFTLGGLGVVAWWWLLGEMWLDCDQVDKFGHGLLILIHLPFVCGALASAVLAAFAAVACIPRPWAIHVAVGVSVVVAVAVVVWAVSMTYSPVAHGDVAPSGCPNWVPSWWPFPASWITVTRELS